MSQISKCHRELTNGVGKCSVPMWMNGLPAGFCDAPAYGEQTAAGKHAYSGYVPALACPRHGGPPPPDVGVRASRLALAERVREACRVELRGALERMEWNEADSEATRMIGGVDLSKLVEGE